MRKMFQLLQSSILNEFEFFFAVSLSEALNELGKNPEKYQVILSDYFLPDGEAKDLFPLPVELPIIVLTATYNVDMAVALIKSGADDFLVKDKEMKFVKLLPEKIKSVMEKKEAEIEANRQEQRFRDLFENSNDIIFYLSNDGFIRLPNPLFEELLGYTPAEARTLLFADIIGIKHREAYLGRVSLLAPGQKFDDVEVEVTTKSKTILTMEGSVRCGLLSDGTNYTRAIFRDITARKKDEIKIREQFKDLTAKNEEINNGLIKLRNMTISRKAAVMVFGLAIALFLISEFWLEPWLVQYSGNRNYTWINKVVIVLLLKPIDMFIERWLLRQKIKAAGLS